MILMSKNTFEVRDNIISISNDNWTKLAFAEFREDYYEELTSVTWSKNGDALYSNKLRCYLHQYIIEKWYGKEMLDEMYKNGFIIEHLDNNEFNNSISNLEFLLQDYNTAKGQSLDKDIIKYRDKIALRMYKNFDSSTYEISIAFNEPFDESGFIKPIQAMHFLYECDYYGVILDANRIIHDYITLGEIPIKKLSHTKMIIDYAQFISLTKEEVERIGNGKGGIIERNGKTYLIPGKNLRMISSHQIKKWD